MDKRLTFIEKTMSILDRDVRRLCSRDVSIIKVQWRCRPIEVATWELEFEIYIVGTLRFVLI